MPRVPYIELGEGRDLIRIPILYENRSVIAIDKPAGWLLIPSSWQQTERNLQTAIASAIGARYFWARSRNLRFLRYVHRLDGETTGILLLAKSPGAVETYSRLFESREVEKRYLAVVHGVPRQKQWICCARIAPDPKCIGRMWIDPKHGKEAETAFRFLQSAGAWSLVEATPITGRTHQIRLHLLAAGHPVVGDQLYGGTSARTTPTLAQDGKRFPLGLRAVSLSFIDPFLRRPVHIVAPTGEFLAAFGLGQTSDYASSGTSGGPPNT